LVVVDEDDQTPHVSDVAGLLAAEGFGEVELGLTSGEEGVECGEDQTPQEVPLEATGDDDHTPHVPEAGLLLPVGLTGVELGVVFEEGVTDVPQLPQDVEADGLLTDTGVYGDEEVFSATGDVLEFPSQLPQDEDRAASDVALPLPQDPPGVPAGAVCQSPQLPEPPCLSRLSTTPAKTELAKASRTNELFTMLAT
jgi:hypothetical protein